MVRARTSTDAGPIVATRITVWHSRTPMVVVLETATTSSRSMSVIKDASYQVVVGVYKASTSVSTGIALLA